MVQFLFSTPALHTLFFIIIITTSEAVLLSLLHSPAKKNMTEKVRKAFYPNEISLGFCYKIKHQPCALIPHDAGW